MEYEHFLMRLHDDSRAVPGDPTSWALRTRYGPLNAFFVGAVENPAPVPKTQVESIPGLSGVLDMTEAAGRVFFDNKTVSVTLSGEAGFCDMEGIERLFAPYQGRVVDFSFDDYLNVKWYQTGRMTASFDRFRNRIFLTFDCKPFRYSTEEHRSRLYVGTNYEVSDNTDTWSLTYSPGTLLKTVDNVTDFAFYVDAPGRTITRKKVVAAEGEFYALGIISIQGGTVEFWNFTDDDDYYSKTIALSTLQAPPVDGNTGLLWMRITVDGSYWEWALVSGVMRYLPTIRCEYVLSKLPMTNGKIRDDVKATFQTNVIVRPDITNTSADAYIILDGTAVKAAAAVRSEKLPNAVLPGINADFSGIETESVFLTIPQTTGTPVTSMVYFPVEVF